MFDLPCVKSFDDDNDDQASLISAHCPSFSGSGSRKRVKKQSRLPIEQTSASALASALAAMTKQNSPSDGERSQ